jgi:hypothetical protein
VGLANEPPRSRTEGMITQVVVVVAAAAVVVDSAVVAVVVVATIAVRTRMVVEGAKGKGLLTGMRDWGE